MKNNVLLNVRVKQETIENLNKISDVLEIPYSQFVREAISEKMEKLKAKNPEIKEILNSIPELKTKKSLALQA